MLLMIGLFGFVSIPSYSASTQLDYFRENSMNYNPTFWHQKCEAAATQAKGRIEVALDVLHLPANTILVNPMFNVERLSRNNYNYKCSLKLETEDNALSFVSSSVKMPHQSECISEQEIALGDVNTVFTALFKTGWFWEDKCILDSVKLHVE